MIADQLVVIGEGKIVAQGAKAELLAASGTLVRGGRRRGARRGRSPPPVSPPPPSPDGSLVVEAEPETVGRLAAELGLALIELRPADGGGLEQLFLTLTSREEVAA